MSRRRGTWRLWHAAAGLLFLASGCGAERYAMKVTGSVQGSVNGSLISARVLRSGDRIHFTVRTTAPAHLYVAYCNAMREMEIYPPNREIFAPMEQDVRLPTGDDDFELDHRVGGETIYVIASLDPLDRADPALYAALEKSRAGKGPCAPELDMNPTGEDTKSDRFEQAFQVEPPSAPPLTSEPPRAASLASAAPALPGAPPEATPKPPPRKSAPAPAPPPPPTVQLDAARPKPPPKRAMGLVARGVFVRTSPSEGGVVVSGDAAGVAVLRVAFEHR